MFSKQHHDALVLIMRRAHPGNGPICRCELVQWTETVRDMAEMLERDNPDFDVLKFVKECRP